MKSGDGAASRPLVALLVETSNAFSREILHGVRDWMRANRPWEIDLSEQGRGDDPPSWLKGWKGDGIIARIETAEILDAVKACGVPVVNVSAAGLAPEFPNVISDSEGIARLAAEHLLDLGLENFAFCGDSRFVWSVRHGENFGRRLEAAGKSCSIYQGGARDHVNLANHQKRLQKWLAGLPKPVGIMTHYDIRGQQVLHACRSLGLRVPDEVAVIGHHNDELLCDLCEPPLTSVIPDARRVGATAAEMLDAMMGGKRGVRGQTTIAPLGIATRESTDMVAVPDPGVAAALRFIRAHALEPIVVDDVVRVSGVSRTLLERGFRRYFGRGPYEQILRHRMDAAKMLLTQTSLTIAEVAERAGFSTPEHFSSTFRKRAGVSPRELRRPGK